MNDATYTLSSDDLTAANRLHFRKSFSIRRWVVVFIASALALAMVIWGLDGSSFDLSAYLFGLGFAWAIVIALCVLGWFMIPRQARRTSRQAQKMFIEQHLTWDAEKIHFKSARGEAHISWGDYFRCSADDRSLLLYQDMRTFYVVPLRAFPAGARDEIIGYLRAAGVPKR